MNIISNDVKKIWEKLTDSDKEKLNGKDILITGFAGSLGYTLLKFLQTYSKNLNIGYIYCIDNYMFGKPEWISEFLLDKHFYIREADITNSDLKFAESAKIILHMSSLASPVYYRQHPIETIDADIVGLRRLLDFYKSKNIYNLLFFSTSEVYGNPPKEMVPTNEEYFGNVNTSGPRACYDESKRFGETLCYNYNKQFNMPITVIRPFNSFGPGLRTNDQRVVADFAKNILNNEDIVIFSDGKATRTFCYSADTTIGILKCAAYGKYDIFNIGNDNNEMTVTDLANLYRKVGKKLFNYSGDIVYQTHKDKEYLTDNPQRRCPDITKAVKKLGYRPSYTTEEGIERYLLSLVERKEEK